MNSGWSFRWVQVHESVAKFLAVTSFFLRAVQCGWNKLCVFSKNTFHFLVICAGKHRRWFVIMNLGQMFCTHPRIYHSRIRTNISNSKFYLKKMNIVKDFTFIFIYELRIRMRNSQNNWTIKIFRNWAKRLWVEQRCVCFFLALCWHKIWRFWRFSEEKINALYFEGFFCLGFLLYETKWVTILSTLCEALSIF